MISTTFLTNQIDLVTLLVSQKLNCIMLLNVGNHFMIFLRMVFCKIATKSHIVNKFNFAKSRLHCSYETVWKELELFLIFLVFNNLIQCWTEGRSSTAVAEDLRPTATATVAEV